MGLIPHITREIEGVLHVRVTNKSWAQPSHPCAPFFVSDEEPGHWSAKRVGWIPVWYIDIWDYYSIEWTNKDPREEEFKSFGDFIKHHMGEIRELYSTNKSAFEALVGMLLMKARK